MTDEQRPRFAYTVTVSTVEGPSGVEVVTDAPPVVLGHTLTWPDVPPAERSSLLTAANLDALIDNVRATAGQELGPDWYFRVNPRMYRRLRVMASLRPGQRWQISQRERATIKRQRRERKRAQAALTVQYRAKIKPPMILSPTREKSKQLDATTLQRLVHGEYQRRMAAHLRRVARTVHIPEPMTLPEDYQEIERDVFHSVFVGGPDAKYRLRRKEEPNDGKR